MDFELSVRRAEGESELLRRAVFFGKDGRQDQITKFSKLRNWGGKRESGEFDGITEFSELTK
jgi:hypothetical protein